MPRVIHIVGCLNMEADSLSRVCETDYNWSIQEKYFKIIFDSWGYSQVDLFATAESRKALDFCSLPGSDISSLGDVFQIPWSRTLLYAFPPVLSLS